MGTATDDPILDGDHVIRRGLVFKFGSYPDKQFSLTPDEFRAAHPEFRPVPVGMSHRANVLDGKLGEMVAAEVVGDELHGTVRLPKWLDNLLDIGSRKVSCEWDRATKKLKKLDLVPVPRVPDAVLMSAYFDATGDPAAAGFAKLTQADRDALPASDFAGPDRTFPVTDQDDVDSAARLIGKAADPDAVKARIIKIAKRKGLEIPDAWAGDVGMGDDGTAGDADDPADPADPARTATFAPRKLHDDHTAHMQAHHDLSARHAPSLCLGGRGAGNGTAGMGGAAAFADKTKQVKALKLMHDMAVEHGANCPGRAAMSGGAAPSHRPDRARNRPVTFTERLKRFMGLAPDVELDITEDQARPMVAVFAGVPAGAPVAHEGGTAAGGKADPPAPAPVVSFADSEEGKAMLAKIAALEASDAAKAAALKAAADQLEADRRDRIDREAAAFAEALVRDKRAFPAERDFVAAEFAEAADADHADAKPVTFSVGGQPRQGTRVERLKAKYAARPQHALFDALVTTDALPPEARALFNGAAADAPPSEERLRTLRGYAETGRLINAEAARNGR